MNYTKIIQLVGLILLLAVAPLRAANNSIQNKLLHALAHDNSAEALRLINKEGAAIADKDGNKHRDLLINMASLFAHNQSIAAYQAVGFKISDLYGQFLDAVAEGNTSLVNHYLNAGIGPNEGWQKTSHRMPALILAAAKDYHTIIKLLLDHGAKVNISHKDMTPLSVACKKEYWSSTQLLLAHPGVEKINPNVIDHEIGTPLLATCSEKMAKLLLEHTDIDPHYKDALHWAIKGYDTKRFNLLLRHKKTDPNKKDKDGMLPLIYSTKGQRKPTGDLYQLAIIRALLAHPYINPTISTTGGLTPLEWSLQEPACLEIFNLLLQHPKVKADSATIQALLNIEEERNNRLNSDIEQLKDKQKKETETLTQQHQSALQPLQQQAQDFHDTILQPLQKTGIKSTL